MTTYPPMQLAPGTRFAEQAPLDIVNAYRAGALSEETRRFIDLTIDQCDRQGVAAAQWVDGVVALNLRRWARAQLLGDAEQETRSMLVAACAIAAVQLRSDTLALV